MEKGPLFGYPRRLRREYFDGIEPVFGWQRPKEVRQQCAQAVMDLKNEWLANVVVEKRGSVEKYYQHTPHTIYELIGGTLCVKTILHWPM